MDEWDVTDILTSGSDTSTISTYIKVGQKRIRIDVSVDSNSDSEAEWDNWFEGNILDKVGFRRMWVHPTNLARPLNGEYVRICVPYCQYPQKFFSYFRMSVSTFDYVLEGIEQDLCKKSVREPISPGERLSVTLRYLSTGISYTALLHSFCMSSFTVSVIVKEVCAALWNQFINKHMAVPTVDDFEEIADQYEILWNFPHVIGFEIDFLQEFPVVLYKYFVR